jgi:myo-inositol 2-dehydrogenase/D-chiro-inositol 1-dehydrogenase
MNDEIAAWAKSLEIPHISLDHKSIIEDREIDAVLICSPTDTHSPISLQAIAAGKHIFCEKPIDHDLGRIRKVIDALSEVDIRYQIGFHRRFDHNFQALRNAVQSGKVGDVQMVKITSRDPGPPSIAYIKVSGGLFLDMMIHDFDMVRYLSGAEVIEVSAYGAVMVDPAIGEAGDIDTAIVTLKLNNGGLAVIDNSRKATFGHDQRAEVFGSKGSVASSNDSESNVVFSDRDGVHSEPPLLFFLERYMQAYRNEITSFIKAIESGSKTEVGVNDGLQPVLVGLAAKKSLKEHRPVEIKEIS